MKKLFINNLALKLVSLLAAFLIWLVVTNVDDPEKTTAFVIAQDRITLLNMEELQQKASEQNQIYRIDDTKNSTNRVIVYVTARNSVLEDLSADDIMVQADMEDITLMSAVPYTVSIDGVRSEDIRCEPSSMSLTLEDIKDTTFAVSTESTGKPQDGYELGSITLENTSINIAGPYSIVNIIDKVSLIVDINNLNQETQTVVGELQIKDKNGSTFTSAQMDNITIKSASGELIEDGQMYAEVTLWKIQENVRLQINPVGEPGDGYQITSVTTTPDTVNIAATEGMLEQLNGVLPIDGVVDVTGKTESFETTIDLSEYLLENYSKDIKLETDSVTAVSVRVQIEKMGSKTVNVPVSSFQTVGAPENMKLVMTPADQVSIEIESNDGSGVSLTAEDVKVTLDLSNYQTAGNYEVQLDVELPEGYSLVSDPTIKINLSPIEETEIDTESETTTEEG